MLGRVSALDVVDDTFLAVAPQRVAELLDDAHAWRRWWPDLRLSVVQQRGAAGIRWRAAGACTGTMEVWLEPVADGTVVHYFLHAERPGAHPRALAREAHRRRVRAKAMAFELKARTEGGRAPGHPPAPGGPAIGTQECGVPAR